MWPPISGILIKSCGRRGNARLTASDTVRDIDTARVSEAAARLNKCISPSRLTLRTRSAFSRFFTGLDLVEPGIVATPDWRGPGSEYPIPCYAGMGRKP